MLDCKDCKASKLRHRLAMYEPTYTSDGLGGREVEWNYSHTARASVKFSSIRETETGEVLEPAGNATATARRRAQIPAGWHAKIGDAEYRVVGEQPLGTSEAWKKVYLRRVEHQEIA